MLVTVAEAARSGDRRGRRRRRRPRSVSWRPAWDCACTVPAGCGDHLVDRRRAVDGPCRARANRQRADRRDRPAAVRRRRAGSARRRRRARHGRGAHRGDARARHRPRHRHGHGRAAHGCASGPGVLSTAERMAELASRPTPTITPGRRVLARRAHGLDRDRRPLRRSGRHGEGRALCSVDDLAATVERLTRYRGPVTLRPTIWFISGGRIAELGSGDMIEAATALHDPERHDRSAHRRKEDLTWSTTSRCRRRRRNATIVAVATLARRPRRRLRRRTIDRGHGIGGGSRRACEGRHPRHPHRGADHRVRPGHRRNRRHACKAGVLDALDLVDADMDKLIADSSVARPESAAGAARRDGRHPDSRREQDRSRRLRRHRLQLCSAGAHHLRRAYGLIRRR